MNWLKINLVSSLTRSERQALVKPDESELPLSIQAELPGVSRSSLYQPKMPTPEEVTIKHPIDEIYTEYPFFGSRRIAPCSYAWKE